MNFKDFLFLVIAVFKNWQVIATAVFMLVVIGFTDFILKYKKKPRKIKVKKAPKAPVAAPVEETSSEPVEE